MCNKVETAMTKFRSKEMLKESDKIIKSHVKLSMIAGAVPIMFVDITFVTGVQIDMIKKMAKLYDINFDSQEVKSLITALASSTTGAVLGRFGASFVKAVPVVGTVLGVSSQVLLSGATTYATGKVFQNHFHNSGNIKDFKANKYKKSFKEFFDLGKKNIKKEEAQTSSETNTQTNEDIVKAISRLKELKDDETITQEEFDLAKAELLKKLQK